MKRNPNGPSREDVECWQQELEEQEAQRQRLLEAKRELLREMRERGIRKVSCFNGGLSADEYSFNKRLFELNTKINQ